MKELQRKEMPEEAKKLKKTFFRKQIFEKNVCLREKVNSSSINKLQQT